MEEKIVFTMVLAWSRHQYVEFVFEQTLTTWLVCHQHAFEFFGEEVRCAEPFFAVLAALGGALFGPVLVLITGLAVLALVYLRGELAAMGDGVDFDLILPLTMRQLIPVQRFGRRQQPGERRRLQRVRGGAGGERSGTGAQSELHLYGNR